MTETLSVSEAKERLSEIVERVADSGDRFVIESRGRPVAAVVRAEELSGLQEEADRPEGLLGAVGILSEEDEEEWEETVSEIYRQRRQTKPRPVPIEHSTDGLIGAMGAWTQIPHLRHSREEPAPEQSGAGTHPRQGAQP